MPFRGPRRVGDRQPEDAFKPEPPERHPQIAPIFERFGNEQKPPVVCHVNPNQLVVDDQAFDLDIISVTKPSPGSNIWHAQASATYINPAYPSGPNITMTPSGTMTILPNGGPPNSSIICNLNYTLPPEYFWIRIAIGQIQLNVYFFKWSKLLTEKG